MSAAGSSCTPGPSLLTMMAEKSLPGRAKVPGAMMRRVDPLGRPAADALHAT